MDETKGPNKAIIGAIIVAVLVIATVAIVMLSKNESTQTAVSDTSQTNQTTSSGSGTNAVTTGTYKDGTYNATGSYQTPGGKESIEVKLTVADNTITDATVTQNAASGEAEEYQSAFVSGYKSQVVGKKVNDVSLSRVAGSSLTPLGFNEALSSIKSEASA